MCGIAGSISTIQDQSAYLNSIAHRGPDDQGEFKEGLVTLGHCRLSILDLSTKAHQPMVSSDGNYIIIFNGEIYNHLTIRGELLHKGYTFTSTSDTESLLYGFIEYGLNVLNKLNGIFSFAIYDKKKQQVILARDQFGIKPLYFFHKNNCFLFASEIKAFLHHPAFDKSIDFNACYNYIQFLYCPTNATPFQYVKRLDAGHYMVVQLHDATYTVQQPVQYYDIPFNGTYDDRTEAEWIDVVEQALIKAVDQQLLSDVPVGFFLSGGLDSSLIVAIATQALQKKFTCYTIAAGEDMQKEGFSDDLPYAKKVAKQLGIKMEVIHAVPDILKDFDKMIWHLDEPQADAAAIHVYNISKGARSQGIKVLLGGTAGDDVFSGYRRHQALRMETILKRTPAFIRSSIASMLSSVKSQNPQIRRLKKFSTTMAQGKLERLAGYFQWLPDDNVRNLFTQEVASTFNRSEISSAYYINLLENIPREKNDLNRMLYWELKTFLVNHNLNYTDKMSMAAGVEARVPFLDVDLVNLSARIPPNLKMKGSTTKYILKKVAERYLPKEVIYRSKSGFGAPIRQWIKEDMKPMIAERLSEQNIQRRGIFSYKAIQQLIQDNNIGKSDNAYQIFSLLAIESWLAQFAD